MNKLNIENISKMERDLDAIIIPAKNTYIIEYSNLKRSLSEYQYIMFIINRYIQMDRYVVVDIVAVTKAGVRDNIASHDIPIKNFKSDLKSIINVII